MLLPQGIKTGRIAWRPLHADWRFSAAGHSAEHEPMHTIAEAAAAACSTPPVCMSVSRVHATRHRLFSTMRPSLFTVPARQAAVGPTRLQLTLPRGAPEGSSATACVRATCRSVNQ